MKKITNEISSVVYSLPWFIARDEGYFLAEGLDVEFIKAGGGGPGSVPASLDEAMNWKGFGNEGSSYGLGITSKSEDPETVDTVGGHFAITEGRVSIFRA
jgi:hypothetical protein